MSIEQVVFDHLKDYHLILASKSPRRHTLLGKIGLKFDIKTKDIKEHFPDNLRKEEIALYLSKQKAEAFSDEIKEKTVVIAADTIVWCNKSVLGKPENREQAIKMLQKLSGRKHQVITGVCIKSRLKTVTFYAKTKVFFKKLRQFEIEHYIDTYKPYDKAGSYGIQEWIGYVGVEKIKGSYFNVMGLPIQRLYEELAKF